MEPIILAVLLFGVAWTVIFGIVHFRTVGKAKAAANWPTSMGRVLSSEVIQETSSDTDTAGRDWYNPVISYSYSVDGRDHRGTRLRFGNVRYARQQKAEAALAPYPAGAAATVRYNPANPEECVLEAAKPSPLYLAMALFGLVFIGFALFLNGMT